MRVMRVENDTELERFAALGSLVGPSSAAEVAASNADEHWMACDADGSPLARLSLWWKNTPQQGAHRLGLVGHYAALSDDAAAALLATACDRLREQGCTRAVGPLDGNTWRRYRFVIERGTEPMFFLDIDQPDAWPRQFVDAGFYELARYTSSINPDLGRRHEREAEWAGRVRDQGITLRPLDTARAERDLKNVFAVSSAAFAQNFLYTPIDEESFLRMYRSMIARVRPELVLLAERGADTVGFVFCVPDLLQEQRPGGIDTVVLKSFAVHPQAMKCGLGSHLAASAQRAAQELGYRRLIYAFMHEANPSVLISAHFGPAIRQYALYGKEIAE